MSAALRAALSRPLLGSLTVLVAVVALVAGCGGGSGSTVTVSSPGTIGASKPHVIVEASAQGFNAEKVFKDTAPGVVTILSIFNNGGGILGASGPAAGQGSGFVLNTDGEIVTNAHVVTDGTGGNLKPAKQVYVEFTDLQRVPAQVLGYDPFGDVALIKVDPSGLDLKPLKLGNDSTLAVGEPVAAIGSPFGEEQSLSTGVISATNRSVKSLTQFQIEGAIQTDAAINPGNSGGPLLDPNGQVIGINQQIETRSDTNSGVGFAVPVSQIKRSLPQLRQGGKAEYAYIGVSSQALYPQLAHHLGLATDYGGLIARVVPGGPAADAGLKGGDHTVRFQASRVRAGGDVILAVDGKKVVLPDDLARLISTYRPGDKVTLQVLKDGSKQNVEVTLGTRPTSISG
jgi:S1-C subfamily serine protease